MAIGIRKVEFSGTLTLTVTAPGGPDVPDTPPVPDPDPTPGPDPVPDPTPDPTTGPPPPPASVGVRSTNTSGESAEATAAVIARTSGPAAVEGLAAGAVA